MCAKGHYNLYNLGKDEFEDGYFSSEKWSSPTLVSPEKIRALLDSFHLRGRKVSCLKMISTDYCHASDRIEEVAYQQQKELPEELRRRRSDYSHIPREILFEREAMIDEPLLIGFEDKDRFEIDALHAGKFRMSMNCIPWCVISRFGGSNVTADILFTPCIGQTVTDVEINTYLATKHPLYGTAFQEPPFQRELVSNITLWLDNDIGLRIGGWIDFCRVDCIDHNGKILEMRYEELKPALYNWEDLHTDERVGFQAHSSALFFGSKGGSCCNFAARTIYPKGELEWRAYINPEGFLLLEWCVTHKSGAYFMDCDGYEYSAEEWRALLAEAERLLAVATFDELFDELVGWNIRYDSGANCLLESLNAYGAGYWKNREMYRELLQDLYAWSKLALAEDGFMCIGDPL